MEKVEIKNYINFLEWKESPIKQFIFSPRVDNALYNWIYRYLLNKEIKNYDYNNVEHIKISESCFLKTDKIMENIDSIILYLSKEKINIREFQGFWEKSYQEFLDKLNKL